MPRYPEEEQAQLMKEERYVSYIKRDHTAYDCPRKRKIAAISKSVIEDSNN